MFVIHTVRKKRNGKKFCIAVHPLPLPAKSKGALLLSETMMKMSCSMESTTHIHYRSYEKKVIINLTTIIAYKLYLHQSIVFNGTHNSTGHFSHCCNWCSTCIGHPNSFIVILGNQLLTLVKVIEVQFK